MKSAWAGKAQPACPGLRSPEADRTKVNPRKKIARSDVLPGSIREAGDPNISVSSGIQSLRLAHYFDVLIWAH
jgi:hypothetical protein